jgi:hypothetical protein
LKAGGKRSVFFFEKKQQKTFVYFGCDSPGETEAEFAKFFGSFFQKRTASAACLGAALDIPAYLGSYFFFSKKQAFLPLLKIHAAALCRHGDATVDGC